jgi:hypothetical protein
MRAVSASPSRPTDRIDEVFRTINPEVKAAFIELADKVLAEGEMAWSLIDGCAYAAAPEGVLKQRGVDYSNQWGLQQQDGQTVFFFTMNDRKGSYPRWVRHHPMPEET